MEGTPTEARPATTGTAAATREEKLPEPLARMLQQSAAYYARGDLLRAEGLCRQLLQTRPDQPDALHILGLIAWRRGERERALDEIGKAIARSPNKAAPHNSLGVMRKELGDLAGAEAEFRAAIALTPNYPEALTNLGNILCETGRLADAVTAHRRAVELAPKYADAHNNLATALSRQELLYDAVEECRIAVDLEAARADFHLNLGNALSAIQNWEEAAPTLQHAAALAPTSADAHANLGIALYRLGKLKEAAEEHSIATRLRPDSGRIWANLGAAQADLGESAAAIESCQKAIRLQPDLPEAHYCLGLALKESGLQEEAIAAYNRALELRPDYHKAYSNLGTIFQARGQFAEALAAYTRAVTIMPEYSEAHWNKGLLHLLLADFEAGWRGYERGLDMTRARARFRYDQFALWQGATIAGKTIAVTGEQGVGDQIMFASLLPDLVARGANVLMQVEKRLHPLLHRSMKGLTLLSNDDAGIQQLEHVDYTAPIGSLCRWLRPTLESFPARAGYLVPDPAKVGELRQRYRRHFGARPIVGISWRGGFKEVGRLRSIQLIDWSPILTQDDIGFVNLQYGDCRADLSAAQTELGAEILHDRTVDPLKDLDAFAAQTAAMDLVVSIDNSTVHMAGALNVPTWLMLPMVPDWRWMLERSDSPWYPSLRLFRQSHIGGWASVLAAVGRELAEFEPREI